MIPKQYYNKADISTKTIDRSSIETQTGNVYEAISIISKRSQQINTELRTELGEKLEEFSVPKDLLDEVFENREQIEVSKYYEKLPKPHVIATHEWVDGQTYFRKTSEEGEES
ncbi:RNA polymerase Rpb6 [Elysia marginata]|uniref:RNA polymerase Rpb6 n=1 Tax=Elysia marginata TaxID=1093978 RepID=A0AAV4GJ53_9GAST|nr:RNA polymerase Rpb6 [Elysia marginata]